MKNKYLELSNIAKKEWNNNIKEKLITLLEKDERVSFFEDLHKRDEQNRYLFKIKSKELSGIYPVSIITASLHESNSERAARIDKQNWRKDIEERIKKVEYLFFDMNEITLDTALKMLDEIKKEVPKLKDGILWQESLLSRSYEDLKHIKDFEKAMKNKKVSHNDILRTIHIMKTGRRIKNREEKAVDKVLSFFSEYFKTGTIFKWDNYCDLYKLSY
jgi:uncharacterized protein YfkK (UPF0435 family)